MTNEGLRTNGNDDISRLTKPKRSRAETDAIPCNLFHVTVYSRQPSLKIGERQVQPRIMAFFGSSTSSTAVNTNAEKDIEVADPPQESISSLSFSPVADYLAVGSWDNNARLLHYRPCTYLLTGLIQ